VSIAVRDGIIYDVKPNNSQHTQQGYRTNRRQTNSQSVKSRTG